MEWPAENNMHGARGKGSADSTGSNAADAQRKPASSGAALLRLARKQRSPKSASPPVSNRQGSFTIIRAFASILPTVGQSSMLCITLIALQTCATLGGNLSG